ncbi:MAG: hypothetical protein HOO92_16995, partial [Methylococcaceae bacterium]|nr:hypothetical protein [Methylococcaceae bacterium]
MNNERPDPDELLARVERDSAKAKRGRLKIFFGAAAGVGKSYAMLLAARERRAENLDVVVGLIETHGRKETQALLEGLEVLPTRKIDYKGTIPKDVRVYFRDIADHVKRIHQAIHAMREMLVAAMQVHLTFET